MSIHNVEVSKPTVITGDRESWLTKQQAAQCLGVAEKTVDRMVKAGELHKEILKRPKQVPIVIFHPGEVHRVKAARTVPVVMRPELSSDSVRTHSDSLGPTRTLSDSLPDMSTLLPELISSLRYVRWGKPVYMTTEQAAEHSGLTAGYLGKLVREGKLRRLEDTRPYRYRTVELEAL